MRIRSLLIACACLASLPLAAVRAAEVPPAQTQFATVVPGLPLTRAIRSMRDLRYSGVVRQETDFTCGAAALATILQQVFGRSVGEHDIVQDMLRHTDAATVEQKGFTLLDLKRYVERNGLRAHGYRVDRNALLTLKIPAIALQNTHGYAHFVVVKRVRDGLVYLADPALGNRQMLLDDFVAAWNGILFAVVGNGLKPDNALVDSAHSVSAAHRAGIVTRTLPPQQEFGLLGMDTF